MSKEQPQQLPIPITTQINTLDQSSMDIMSIINAQKQLDKMMVLNELMKIYEVSVNIAGQETKILNQELLTEYTSAKITKFMVRNETWRRCVQEVFHMRDIDEEHLVGAMDTQIILKMKSHRRKGSQEIVNALRNEVSGTEVIPSKTRTKKFLGIV